MKKIFTLILLTFLFINCFSQPIPAKPSEKEKDSKNFQFYKKKNKNKYGFKDKQYGAIGFVTNLPEEIVGFNIMKITPQKIGFFIDIKSGLPIRENADDFYDNISLNKAENIFGDELLTIDEHWISVNSGLTKAMFRTLALYAGIGFSFFTQYRQYKDEFEILGNNGKYWISNDDKSKTTINLLGGALIKLSDFWILQIGIETNPSGLGLGIIRVMNP